MGGRGFLRGVCNKNAILRRGFKKLQKNGWGAKQKLFVYPNFMNYSTSQSSSSVSDSSDYGDICTTTWSGKLTTNWKQSKVPMICTSLAVLKI